MAAVLQAYSSRSYSDETLCMMPKHCFIINAVSFLSWLNWTLIFIKIYIFFKSFHIWMGILQCQEHKFNIQLHLSEKLMYAKLVTVYNDTLCVSL